jgi:hypothetical protein
MQNQKPDKDDKNEWRILIFDLGISRTAESKFRALLCTWKPDACREDERAFDIHKGITTAGLKFEIEHLTPDDAMQSARFLATIVGKGHSRQMNLETRKSWQL